MKKIIFFSHLITCICINIIQLHDSKAELSDFTNEISKKPKLYSRSNPKISNPTNSQLISEPILWQAPPHNNFYQVLNPAEERIRDQEILELLMTEAIKINPNLDTAINKANNNKPIFLHFSNKLLKSFQDKASNNSGFRDDLIKQYQSHIYQYYLEYKQSLTPQASRNEALINQQKQILEKIERLCGSVAIQELKRSLHGL